MVLFLSEAGTVKKYAPPVRFNDVAPQLGQAGLGTSSLANVGDVNNDEIDDIAVGGLCDLPDNNTEGCVYICHMQRNGTASPCTRIDGLAAGTYPSQGDIFGGWIAVSFSCSPPHTICFRQSATLTATVLVRFFRR